MLYLIKHFNTQNWWKDNGMSLRIDNWQKGGCFTKVMMSAMRVTSKCPLTSKHFRRACHTNPFHSQYHYLKKKQTKARNEWPRLLVKASSIMSEQLKEIQLERHSSNPALSFPAWAHSQRHCFSPQSSLSIILPVTQKGHFMITY